MGTEILPDVGKAIHKASCDLVTGLGTGIRTLFAVRSSAANEDEQ